MLSTHSFAAFRTPANGCVRNDFLPITLRCRSLGPLHAIHGGLASREQRIMELLSGVIE